MRQKRVKEETISKYISFLNTIKSLANVKDRKIKYIVEENSIDKMIVRAMQDLKIIRMEGSDFWEWLTGDVNRKMVLEILDKLLHYKKKTIHTPLNSEWATVAKTLSTISDRLGTIASQNERLLKTAKNNPEQVNGKTLFSSDEQYHNDLVRICSAIASTAYSKYDTIGHGYHQREVNNLSIVEIAKDLLNKINDEHNKS